MRFDQVDDPATQVILHPDRETYSMTESIRPTLEIRNRSDYSVEIVGGFAFDWERLAFCTPNAVHLMAPDGRDLMRPYHREAPFLASEYPIRLGPGSSHWRYLPVSNFLHLRQVGEYELWLELLDSTGELHRTDHVTFRITDVEPSVPPGTIELSLGSSRSVYSSAEPTVVTPIFTNYGERRLVLLTPQEDSIYGWANPIYQFTVLDGDGRGLALARRSGSMAARVYDDTTKIPLPPGRSAALDLELPDFPAMREPGTYRVGLTYIVRGEDIGKGGDVLDRSMGWDDEVFRGRLESNELAITVL
jgi:hypothetical protein